MRTFFEPDREEEFEAAKDLLIRRCLDWADDCGLASDDLVLTAALDSRHRSRDGRLASGMPPPRREARPYGGWRRWPTGSERRAGR
ncbi:hypothetical protein ACWEPL_03590 [Nonomuraea sp. NPDC004186]